MHFSVVRTIYDQVFALPVAHCQAAAAMIVFSGVFHALAFRTLAAFDVLSYFNRPCSSLWVQQATTTGAFHRDDMRRVRVAAGKASDRHTLIATLQCECIQSNMFSLGGFRDSLVQNHARLAFKFQDDINIKYESIARYFSRPMIVYAIHATQSAITGGRNLFSGLVEKLLIPMFMGVETSGHWFFIGVDLQEQELRYKTRCYIFRIPPGIPSDSCRKYLTEFVHSIFARRAFLYMF